jgi:hypothetical protein
MKQTDFLKAIKQMPNGDPPALRLVDRPAALLPMLRAKLDELSDGLAQAHAPMHATLDGKVSYDMQSGRKAARRALIEALLAWIENDDALDGDEIAIIEYR